jgi:hypothetical protein
MNSADVSATSQISAKYSSRSARRRPGPGQRAERHRAQGQQREQHGDGDGDDDHQRRQHEPADQPGREHGNSSVAWVRTR